MERGDCYTEVLLLIEKAELAKHLAYKHSQQVFFQYVCPNSTISGGQ